MKLEKFKQNSKQKKIMIGSIVGLILLIGGVSLYRTFALYEEKKEFNVLKGKIPNFMETDVSLAFVVDGVASEKVPARGNYKVEVTCDGGYGEWDYTAWDIVVRSFTNGTKCDVKFTSVTEEEMPEYKTIKKVTKNAAVTLDACESCTKTKTFDFSEVPGYENLTADNFIAYVSVNPWIDNGSSGWLGQGITSIKYDSNSGIVTITYYYRSPRPVGSVTTSGGDGSKLYVTAIYY